MRDFADDDPGLDPSDVDGAYRNYHRTCEVLGVEPTPRDPHGPSVNVVAEVRRALRKPNLAVVVNFIAGVVSTRALSLPGALGIMLSMAATAQGLIASDQPASEAGPATGPTMMQVVPYPYGMYALPDVAPAVPSCYRIGRCSAYDLYRFKDRPNRLTRRAPEAPPASVAEVAWIAYRWFLVPATPEENILPPYRAASQVRDEYRAAGRPIDSPD